MSACRVGHLALDFGYYQYLFDSWTALVSLTPAALHPAAATSFSDILRRKLRSLLCVVSFKCPNRCMGVIPLARWRFHFAQTFPLCRRGRPICPFDWLQVDPRPGVDLDLRELPIDDDPRLLLRAWRQLEHGFGVTRKDQQATRGNDHDGCRLYICPAQRWPPQAVEHMQRMNGAAGQNVEAEQEPVEVWSRGELAQHLQHEEEEWLRIRSFPARATGGTQPYPKYRSESPQEDEMFAAMEKLPCTAIGMWLFPAEAFPEPIESRARTFNMGAVRPGLFLFQV